MNLKKILAVTLSLLILLSTAACGAAVDNAGSAAESSASAPAEAEEVSSEAPEESAAESTEETPEESAEAFSVTVTDHAGREVTVTKLPEKLVSGYYISTSLVIGLGLEDKLVGIEAKAASRPIYALAAPELLELPNVGTAKEFNLEGCIALEPELVILPLKLKDAADSLAELGIPAICVNPESEALLNETVDMIAKLTGTEDKAEALKDHGKKALAELEAKLADVEKLVVYLAGNSAYLSTAGSKMYQNTMIEAAGAVNAAAEVEDTYWAEIDYEQLITWNPDYIIVSPAADYTAEDILNDAALAELEAVKEGKVYAMPADYESWDSPVPSAFLGSMWIASQIHSDVFTAEDYNTAIVSYYETFYGFTPEP